MKLRRNFYVLYILTIITWLLVYFAPQFELVQKKREEIQITDENIACKLPKLDPFNPEILPILKEYGNDLKKICDKYKKTPPYKLVDNVFVLKPEFISRIDNNSINVKYINMINDHAIQHVILGGAFPNTIQRSNNVGRNADLLGLDYFIDGKKESDTYFRIVPRSKILREQMRKVTSKGIPTNVLIIGIDSTSQANFKRKLGKVISFLKTKLDTYFLNGMSIVGDTTTHALVAMLTGHFVADLGLPQNKSSYLDDWPWIMKEYEKQGYMTLFSEDDPLIGAFTLRLKGFKKPPVHHYLRPYWITVDSATRKNGGLCLKSSSVTNKTFQYIQDFFSTYSSARKFAFGFCSYLTHGYTDRLSLIEQELLTFLNFMIDSGFYKNTTIIVMGDHGSKASTFRATMQGRLEERLPMFSISLPPMFREKYPGILKNLKDNENIIMSPFDTHQTLRHILTYPEVPRSRKFMSMFEHMPRDRTCIDTGISEHFCVCHHWDPIDTNSEIVSQMVVSLIQHINKELSRNTELQALCHQIELHEILAATKLDKSKMKFQEDKTQGNSTYQLNIITKPNYGRYEATLSMAADGKVWVNHEISRTNLYGNQPHCIFHKYPHLRKYCFCKK